MSDARTLNPHSRDLSWLPIALIALSAVVARLYLMRVTHSTAEDFYITLRYAENIAHGTGFVYNAGERVLGTTTPLYTLFLALVAKVGANPTFWGKLVNILADGASCGLVWRLGRAIGRPGVGLAAAALLALSPPNLTWAISGMETSLVTMTGLVVFVALAARRPQRMACAAATLALLRVDGLLLCLVAFSALWYETKRFPSRSLALFSTLIAPWMLFATLYFGSPIPSSLRAKLTVYAWHSRGLFPNAAPFLGQMTHSAFHLLLLISALLGLYEAATRAHGLRPAALWMLLYYGGMALSRGFLFGWYYVPPSPVYFLVAALGWSRAVDRIQRSLPAPRRHALALLGTGLIMLLGLHALPGVQSDIAGAQAVEDRLRKPIGATLRGIVRPGEQVMLEPIGYIGYYSGTRILDAVGLVSPQVVPYYRRGAVSPYLDMLADLRPEYVLLRAGEYHDAVAAPVPPDRALRAHYRLLRVFPDPMAPPHAEPAFYLLRRETGGRERG